jgi:hypothetical protein
MCVAVVHVRYDVALVWVDVQGWEAAVFRGGRDLFSRDIPVVAEIWPYGLERACTPSREFAELVQRYWATYWVLRRGRFTPYPTSVFPHFMQELGVSEGSFENVIFTHSERR